MRGMFDVYHNPVDENGKTRLERQHEEAYAKSSKAADERILKMLEEDWTVGDVPETFCHTKKKQPVEAKPKASEPTKKPALISNKGPTTIASRKAASALSVAPKSASAAPKATVPKSTTSFLSRAKPAPALAPANTSTMRHVSAAAASRSTLGYTKGRSASSVLQKREGGFQRSTSNVSQASDTTITPARFAQKEADPDSEEWRRLKFLEAFNVDDEEIEPGLRGLLPESLRRAEEEDEEFVMPMPC